MGLGARTVTEGNMARDDYYVIVYKILAYLYIKLKTGEEIEPEMLMYDGSLFQINRKYWVYIFENLFNDGYITDVNWCNRITSI